ncbi:MAG: 4-carboxymuconolactone decarboxylase [Arenicellales bacterium]
MSETDDRYLKGMRTRRAVLGDAHVDSTEAAKTPLDADFQRFITESAWGSVWARSQLSTRERSMLTIALLAGLGYRDELAMHIRATRNTGATLDDVREVLLHVAVYAGVPAANVAYSVAKNVYQEIGHPAADQGMT